MPPNDQNVTTTEARQGKTGMGVRYVLAISLIAIVVLFAFVYLFFMPGH